ncbi:MAG: type I pantothenate kinase, partial [Coxiella sp. (in: Bacteria)]
MSNTLSAYLNFTRSEWEQYRHDTPLVLNEGDLERLHGVNEIVSMTEIKDVFLPLSRLINMYVTETQSLYTITKQFLAASDKRVPYIIGVSGSVAVGKSTVSRILQALLSRWDNHPKVALVTTDGFLYPTAELEAQGLMHRKGFPESYDVAKLLSFLEQLKSGKPSVQAPIYSHQIYDILPNEYQVVKGADIVIVEGLNLLQNSVVNLNQQPQLFVSDFIDFSIFVDAEMASVRQWYVERVLYFCNTSFKEPGNYFQFLSEMLEEEQVKFAERIWREINEVNLLENI